MNRRGIPTRRKLHGVVDALYARSLGCGALKCSALPILEETGQWLFNLPSPVAGLGMKFFCTA